MAEKAEESDLSDLSISCDPELDLSIQSSLDNYLGTLKTVNNSESKDKDTNKVIMDSLVSSWDKDPLHSQDWDKAGVPGPLCAGRVKRDIVNLFKDPLPDIFVCPMQDNLFMVHCLIIGPFDTPYEGGFLHFIVRFGPQYPLHPPRVKLLTTSNGTVRFNPNLYANGKVCLSILGTWSGPAWSPASNLGTVLLSLQSLLSEKPYHNEPGYEREMNMGDSKKYNKIIQHETLRVSVVEQLENFSGPTELYEVMKSSFLNFYDHYISICKKNINLDGKQMLDPFSDKRGLFKYKNIMERLEKLKNIIKLPEKEIVNKPTSTAANEIDEIVHELPNEDNLFFDTDSLDSSTDSTPESPGNKS